MAVILRKLPFFNKATTVNVRNQIRHVKSYQIIVWVSLAGAEWDQLEPNNRYRFRTRGDTCIEPRAENSEWFGLPIAPASGAPNGHSCGCDE
jgi:hypothetical protein